MKTVTVESLVGQDVAGMRANVVAPEHRHLFRQEADQVVTLKKAEYRTMKGEQWVYLTWEPRRPMIGFRDCGYSGWHLGAGLVPTVDLLTGGAA